MKNLFKTMMLVAVAAMGFTACSNEAFEEVNPANEKTFTLTISAEKPALESDTRTEFFNNSVIWTANDQIRACYYHSTGVWSRYYASQTNNVAADGSTATFTNFNDFPALEGGTYIFYAGYPKNIIGNNSTDAPTEGVLSVEVATEQTMPKAGTFDANADILLGEATEVISEIPAGDAIELSFIYTRQVAHGCVTLKNLAAKEGEIVKTVKFTAPEDVKLTGNGSVNFVEQTMTALSNNTVTVAMPTNTAANENVVVWFCSAPATIASGAKLTVEVETTRGTYTREITAREGGIQFKQNRYNTLGIDMTLAEFEAAPVSETVYKQITSMAELTSGEYIIAGKNGTSYYAMNAMSSSGKASGSLVIVENSQITENNVAGTIFTLTVSGNRVDIFDGTKYLVYNATAGTDLKLDSGTSNDYWNVSFTDGMFKFLSNKTSNRGLLFRGKTTNQFGGYAISNWNNGEYYGLYLFKKTTGEGGGETPEQPEPTPVLATPTNLTADAVEKDVTITWDEVANATSYYVTCGSKNKTVTDCEADFTMDAYSTEYNITVVAKADGYTDSDAATTTVTTEDDPNAGGNEPDAGNISTLNVTNINSVKAMGNGSYGDYKDKDVTITVEGVTYVAKNICANQKNYPSGFAAQTFIQMKKDAASYFYNTTKTVKSIKVWSNAVNYEVRGGNSENPKTKVTAARQTTETVAVKDNLGNAKDATMQVEEYNTEGGYFALVTTKNACHIYKIEVTYAN